MTSDTPQDFDGLVRQTQIAHRLVAGFYQRLLPTIKQLAQQLELTFGEWEPYVTKRPCQKSQDPTSRWAWDMVPMMASSHSYLRTNGNTSEVGDVALDLYIFLDNNYSDQDWEQWGVGEGLEPDAIQLPIGQPVVEIYLGRCDQRSDMPLKQLWMSAGELDENESTIGHWQSISSHINAIYLKKTLTEFIAQPEDTVAQLRTLLEQPVPEMTTPEA